MFPKLYSDLKEGKMDTLKNFVFEMRPVPVKKPTNKLGMKLLELMCQETTDGIMLQCGKEYGFGEESSTRTTDLFSLSEKKLKGLLIDHLKCERHLSVFDKCASNVSKCRNKKFTGKSVLNDVMLYRGKQNIVDAREAAWTDIQRKKMAE